MFVGPLYFYLCKFFNSLPLLWNWYFINCMNSSYTKNIFWYCYFGWLENLKILWLQILRNFCWIKWIKHYPKGIAESTRNTQILEKKRELKPSWPCSFLGDKSHPQLSGLWAFALTCNLRWGLRDPMAGSWLWASYRKWRLSNDCIFETITKSQWNKSRKFICFSLDSDRKKNFLLPHRKTANPQSTCHNRRDDAICRDSEKNITMVLLGTLLEININHSGETHPVPRRQRIL